MKTIAFIFTALLFAPLAALHAVDFLVCEPIAKGADMLNGGGKGSLTAPSADDWLAVISKAAASAK